MIKILLAMIGITAVALAAKGVPVLEYKEYFAAFLIAAIVVPKFLLD